MKKLFRFALCAFALLAVLTLRAQSEAPNFPLPVRPDTLRILGVGNSFTDDGMMYLPELLEAAGIRNVVLGRLYYPGCSLRQHCEFDAADAPKYTYYKSERNRWTTVSEAATLREAVGDERWDVLVVQQSSAYSGIYTSYHPWLERLIERVRFYCPNAGACVAWQMTWAYGSGSDHGAFPKYDNDPQQMYAAVVDVARRVTEECGIETVIPTGTAIQNLRAGEFNNPPSDFTRDGYHLDFGCGRYTAACTWFQALVAPCLRTDIGGNTFRPDPKGHTPVTDESAAKSLRAPFLGVGVSRVRRRRTIRETCRTHVSLFSCVAATVLRSGFSPRRTSCAAATARRRNRNRAPSPGRNPTGRSRRDSARRR